MNCKLAVYDRITYIEGIVSLIEKVAIEYAFNLELILFDEVLKQQGISKEDYEDMYRDLTVFLSYSRFKFSDTHTVYRAQNAHRLMTDSMTFGDNNPNKMLEDCYEWLMPFPVQTLQLK
ncbi:hypothetical protein [Shewanella algicola]|uniref:hypothetical protein n=1 Tax=Shewanella algicola TaxID=640633 RepID=UPI002495225A|nr:hypothetical protein [Shewanella algicola]